MKRIFYEKIRGFQNENFREASSAIPKVDYLKLRNRIAFAAIFAGLLFTVTSFTFGPVDDAVLADNVPQKKEQRVKVVVRKDGKETKIDTTFNLPDEKMINLKVDSMLKNLNVEGIPGHSDIVIHRGGKAMRWNNNNMENLPGEEQFDILVQNGDSGKVMHKRKIIRLSDGSADMIINDEDGDNLMPPPPPPPPPPFPFEYNQRFGGDPFAFDADDSDIISYDKKDIGKGLEKITIIRKKQVKHNLNKDVNVQVDVSDDSKK